MSNQQDLWGNEIKESALGRPYVEDYTQEFGRRYLDETQGGSGGSGRGGGAAGGGGGSNDWSGGGNGGTHGGNPVSGGCAGVLVLAIVLPMAVTTAVYAAAYPFLRVGIVLERAGIGLRATAFLMALIPCCVAGWTIRRRLKWDGTQSIPPPAASGTQRRQRRGIFARSVMLLQAVYGWGGAVRPFDRKDALFVGFAGSVLLIGIFCPHSFGTRVGLTDRTWIPQLVGHCWDLLDFPFSYTFKDVLKANARIEAHRGIGTLGIPVFYIFLNSFLISLCASPLVLYGLKSWQQAAWGAGRPAGDC